MNIIITAATSFELDFLQENIYSTNHEIKYQIHGVGLLQSTYSIAQMSMQNPDLIIQCGIAGAYNKNMQLGDVICVNQEEVGDCGVEDNGKIINVTSLDFFNKNEFPFIDGKLINPFRVTCDLPLAKGITVNMCAGCESTIQHRWNSFKPDIETMEGASLHYVCLSKNIPFLQVRGISNFVEPRNKDNWKIDLAIKNYQDYIMQFIQNL